MQCPWSIALFMLLGSVVAVQVQDAMPVEDSVTEDVVALPVHDEHFLDYVVSLIDEFAPDQPAEQSGELQTTLKKDIQRREVAAAALSEMKNQVDEEKKLAARDEKEASVALKTSDKMQHIAEQGHLEFDDDKTHEYKEEEKLNEVKSRLAMVKKTLHNEKARVKEVRKRVKEEKAKVQADDKRAKIAAEKAKMKAAGAEKAQDSEIDAAAKENKILLAENDASQEVDRMKKEMTDLKEEPNAKGESAEAKVEEPITEPAEFEATESETSSHVKSTKTIDTPVPAPVFNGPPIVRL